MRDGWVEAKLRDLISYSIGGIWGDDPGNSEIDVPVYRQTEFNDSGILTTPADAYRSISKSQLKSRTLLYGDILIQKSAGTPTLPGRVVMVPDRKNEVATFSNFLNLLRPDETKCIPRFAFLCFWFKHHIGRAFEFQRGTNIKNLDLPNYLEEPIFLPPLNQQKRIVDLISSVDSYIEALQQQLERAKRSRNAVLHELLTGGGDGYKEVKLSDVTDLITDGSHFSPKTTDHGIPYVTVRDIKDGFLDLDNAARINEDSYLELEKNGCRPLPNDILFSKDGTVGKVALVVGAERFVVLSSLAIIRSTNSVILPKFLALTMSSSEFQRNAIGSKTGLAIKRIVLKHLRDLRIKVPSIAEQQRIIEIVSEIDLLISCNLKVLAESKKLRTGLLSDLLSGEHEIPASYDKVIGAA